MDLTKQELVDKIAMVDSDLVKLRAEPFNDRKLSALNEYKEYLSDELKAITDENRH